MQKNTEGVNSSKIIRFEALKKELDIPMPDRVLVGGCFDLLHVGHIRFLCAAKNKGNSLIIALENDDFIRMKKKREPLYPQSERAEILASLSSVDMVILLPFFQSEKEYMSLVKMICPAVIAVTRDDPYLTHKKKQADQVGGKVIIVIDRIYARSTSSALCHIQKRL